MRKCEILAPAGSMESLTAAVRCGADAVYLGTPELNARRNASNFGDAELEQAVRYCHERGVKVFLTLNTLIYDEELDCARRIIRRACELGIDALIIQDLGIAKLAHETAPDMFLSASTQLSVHTPAGLEFLARAGFSRAVLARELSFEEIKELAASSPIELEVFVHGALCMCVSGQCYMSSMLGGRSGNRGLCAQPCRLAFSAPGGTGHDLSLKDLSLIDNIPQLQKLGIASLKIEGRMKRPEYVAAAVTACKNAALGQADPVIKNQLQAVFSRSGFTQGYFKAERGREMFGTRQKDDVVSASTVLPALAKLYEKEKPLIPVDFALDIHAQEKPILCAKANGIYVSAEADTVPEPALKKEITPESAAEQLKKCGGTPFYAADMDFCIDEGLSVPAALINRLRRDALGQLLEEFGKPKQINYSELPPDETNAQPHSGKPLIYARFQSVRQIPAEFHGIHTVIVPIDSGIRELESLMKRHMRVCVELPRTLFGAEKSRRNQLEKLKAIGITDVSCGNMGAAQLAKDMGFNVHIGLGSNIFNTPSVRFLEDFGAQEVTLSFELTLNRIAQINTTLKKGIIAYGRVPLMITRNCPVANGTTCQQCGASNSITDRIGVEFPVRCRGGASEILNSRPIYMADRLTSLRGLDFITLYFTTETKQECCDVITAYHSGRPPKGEYTRGLYYRGVE